MLKAKGFKDYKLKVRPVCRFVAQSFAGEVVANALQTTTCEKIQNAFRTQYKVAANTQVTLMFDGEELEPGQDVQDTELEDMDCIEVHIR